MEQLRAGLLAHRAPTRGLEHHDRDFSCEMAPAFLGEAVFAFVAVLDLKEAKAG
jgi:hypothetical protein